MASAPRLKLRGSHRRENDTHARDVSGIDAANTATSTRRCASRPQVEVRPFKGAARADSERVARSRRFPRDFRCPFARASVLLLHAMRRTSRARQIDLDFPQHGGARRGAGRKRVAPRACVPHRARPKLSGRHPLHVTLRLVDGLPTLRSRAAHAVLREALRAGADRNGFRLVHYGALSNHVHLVCEAEDERALARGLQGVTARIVSALNRFWRRVGALFADRYHARELRAPRDVRDVLA